MFTFLLPSFATSVHFPRCNGSNQVSNLVVRSPFCCSRAVTSNDWEATCNLCVKCMWFCSLALPPMPHSCDRLQSSQAAAFYKTSVVLNSNCFHILFFRRIGVISICSAQPASFLHFAVSENNNRVVHWQDNRTLMDTNDSQVQDMACWILNQKSKIHISLLCCGSSRMKRCDHRQNKCFEVFSSVSANWTKLGRRASTNQVKVNTASLKKTTRTAAEKGETLVRLSQILHKTSRVRLQNSPPKLIDRL